MYVYSLDVSGEERVSNFNIGLSFVLLYVEDGYYVKKNTKSYKSYPFFDIKLKLIPK